MQRSAVARQPAEEDVQEIQRIGEAGQEIQRAVEAGQEIQRTGGPERRYREQQRINS
jgi:hypothetical protein